MNSSTSSTIVERRDQQEFEREQHDEQPEQLRAVRRTHRVVPFIPIDSSYTSMKPLSRLM